MEHVSLVVLRLPLVLKKKVKLSHYYNIIHNISALFGMCIFKIYLPLRSQPTSSMRSVQARRQTTGRMRMYWATIDGSKRLVLVLSLSVLPTKI